MKYWMFFRQFAIAGVATGLLAGCNKEPLEAGPDAGEQVEIVSGVALPSPSVTAGTKAPVDGINEELEFFFVRADNVIKEDGGYDLLFEDYISLTSVRRAAGTEKQPLIFSIPQYYLVNGANTLMQGFYPQTVELEEGRRGAVLVTQEFDGNQDILISNILVGNYIDKKINSPNDFKFQHMLSQLQFYAYAENAVAASQWGTITSIQILNQHDLLEFALNDYHLDVENETLFNLCTYGNSDLYPSGRNFRITTNSPIETPGATDNESNDYGVKMAGAVMIEPEQSGTIQLLITTQAAGQPEVETSVEIPAGQADIEAGEAKKIYLKFLAGEVDVTLSAAAWTEISGTDMDVDLGTGSSASGN